jgi:hypothetical protein
MSTDPYRMLVGRTRVLIRAHHQIVNNPELSVQFGEELANAERRIWRRWLAHSRVEDPVAQDLRCCFRELQGLGIFPPGSRLGRLLRQAIGETTDSLALSVSKYLRPRKYASFKKGYE